jgi:1-acyl-sn-glycerol-3-phosphate acyltransferase
LEARRDRWALLYLPWAALVFLPVVLGSMVVLGTTAVLVSLPSPNAGWWVGVLWCRLALLANFTRVELRGLEHVQPGQGYVYLLNHQSHFDVAAFYGHWRRPFRWVLKEELRKVPGLGWYCQVGGHVFVDRKDHARAMQSMERARQRLEREQMSIAFFPEGTRSVDGRLQPFKKGGFVMARQLGLPILPVSVSGGHTVLPGKRMRLLPGRIVVTVHPPIPTQGLTEADQPALMERVREAIASGLTPWERGEEG